MTNHTHLVQALLASAIAGLAIPACYAADVAPVTPYRPSVSSPAQLSAPGQVEFEAGAMVLHDGASQRNSMPVLFKLAMSEQWGVLVGGEAYVQARDESGNHVHGIGDLNLVLKGASAIDPASAVGIELNAKAPTAKDGIGSGKADYGVNGIYSRDLGPVHMDANANLTRLGQWEANTGREQTGLSASFSTPLDAHWGATAELSGTRRHHVAPTTQLLMAAGYMPNPRLSIDVGLAHGLNAHNNAWSLFSGVVLPLGRLW